MFHVYVDKDVSATTSGDSGDDGDQKTPIRKSHVKTKSTPSKPTPTKGGKRKRDESSPEPEGSETVSSSDEGIIVTPKKSQ